MQDDDAAGRTTPPDYFLDSSALEIAGRLLSEDADADRLGRRVGPYVVEAWLGSGGMSDVYRARDLTLQRLVALKFLPEASPSAESLARFKREAQVLASLSHPNIAVIYGFEEAEGECAFAMELIEGPTLADRLAEGAVPLEEALPMARQIAEALEAAHDRGVVHRDLKPSNIAVRADGIVKVLDFGLATALRPEPVVESSDESGPMLGTSAYVSPEQIQRRPTDRRVDIWSFGVVLYELVTGTRPFRGASAAAIEQAVLRQDIDWRLLPSTTPPSVQRLVRRCLERDVKRRLRDMGEARIVLDDPGAAELPVPTATPGLGVPVRARGVRGVVAGALLGAALTGLVAWRWSRPTAPSLPAPAQFTRTLPGDRILALPTPRRVIDLSPDGMQMVYAGRDRLYRQSMADLEPLPIAGTESPEGVFEPTFAPGGQSIAYWSAADRAIKIVATAGGPPTLVCPSDGTLGLSWSADSLVFGGRGGITRVAARVGSNPSLIIAAADGEEMQGPQILPDGDHVLFTLATGLADGRWETARIVVQSLATGERKTLIEKAAYARYIPTGHLVYAQDGGVFAVAFDERRLEMSGAPVASVAGVRRSRFTGAAHFGVSATGSLVFVPGVSGQPQGAFNDVVASDRRGHTERLPVPKGPYTEVRVSPDGTRLAIAADDRKQAVIYVYERSASKPLRMLAADGNNRYPVWSADGSRIAFQSDREGDLAIFSQRADGSGTAARLTTPARGDAHAPESWNPTGDAFLFSVTRGSEVSLWTRSTRALDARPFGNVRSTQPIDATFSRDGHWVAYASAEPGAIVGGIYIEPFPATGERHQLFVDRRPNAAANSAHKPVWSRRSDELFYVPRVGDLEVVPVGLRNHVTFGKPLTIPRTFNPGPPSARRRYDIGPDDQIVGLVPTNPTYLQEFETTRVQVFLNWVTGANGRGERRR